jgi:hypothetical protein
MNSNETVRTEIIGHCGVDSGTLMVIDPCYVLKDERDPNLPYDKSSEYMRTVMPTCEAPWAAPVLLDDYDQRDMGVVFSTLDGDGDYPIIAEYNSAGRIVRVIIDFAYDEDDYEDEDLGPEHTCDGCGCDLWADDCEVDREGFYVCYDCYYEREMEYADEDE